MIEKLIFYSIVGLAVGLVMRYLQKKTAISITARQNEQYSLRMHKLYLIIGTAGTLFGILLTAMIILTGAPFFAAMIILAITFGTGIPCIVYYTNHQAKFDNQAIEVISFWGKKQSIQWAEIKDVSFSAFSQQLSITDTRGNKINIHQHLVGFTTFVNTMEEKTKYKAQELKIPLNG